MTIFTSLFSILTLHAALTVYAQDDQSGFISIDCGIPQGSKYTDSTTGINYVSDNDFIESGEIHEVSPDYKSDSRHFNTLRSFPQNTRNCYNLRPQNGKNNRYLIRARFVYGNYDSRGQNPQFDIYLGADYWITVNITDALTAYYGEMILFSLSDYIYVCLVNTGLGNPFISALELRLLDNTMYELQLRSLNLFQRISFGTNETVRYGDDKYDRIWSPWSLPGYKALQTSDTVSPGPLQLPSKVMSTAITPTNSTGAMSFTLEDHNTTVEIIIYVHLVEVKKLKSDQNREFNIYLNGEPWDGPFSLSTNIITISHPVNGSSRYTLEINKTLDSTLPPIINALEIYFQMQLQRQQTEDQDAAAIWNTKSMYGLKRNWQGDPCVPQAFVWDGLNCSYDDLGNARIISLNLSSSGLSGDIATTLPNFTMIHALDLSYNNLTGTVPEFLAHLDYLKILNLTGNNFTRPLPAELLAKSKKGSLLLSIEASNDEDTSSCHEGSCKNNKHNKVVIPVTATVTVILVLLTTGAIVWMIKRRKTKDLVIREEPFTPKNQQFTFSEVQRFTNNFETVIGRGGFGRVYRGYTGDTQVAVKMLSESSAQGYIAFQDEVKILMTVHHKNITSLIGYCNDNSHKGIIYELMANGNLGEHLFDGSPNVLSWERRLRIGCDAAEGLEYMHHGCRPPIVHRDVKSSNILLNEHFQAKLGDFGLSRAFATEDATHVSTTAVAGTPGYLDPEYHKTNRLTEKSDVYSFGIVLLELITSRRAITEGTPLINWVKSTVAKGSVENIIDPRLQGLFDINTAWKLLELAIACTANTSIDRPTMNYVVISLKQCLQAEKALHETEPNNGYEHLSLNLESMSDINPR